MAEPSASAAGIAATGLTIFGVSTGLDPSILIAGFAGGVWAQSYHPPVAIWRRLLMTLLASILAGYLTPAIAAGVASFDTARNVFTLEVLQLPIAVLVGLTSHRVLGPAIMRFASKKVEELIK